MFPFSLIQIILTLIQLLSLRPVLHEIFISFYSFTPQDSFHYDKKVKTDKYGELNKLQGNEKNFQNILIVNSYVLGTKN